ncbi:hypothetical protein MAR_009590 [Mya arenaria]|uniref:Chitin-binding type-2 domain-containing protein n=1 Tax=Mya arenaria TaxID=6604 RepID=A0ABY7E262_MYAAR|nr:hypothetical protein MAR_009590 [Mya arenaria]
MCHLDGEWYSDEHDGVPTALTHTPPDVCNRQEGRARGQQWNKAVSRRLAQRRYDRSVALRFRSESSSSSTVCGIVCVNRPDGVYEINCRAYSLCAGGMMEVVNCEYDQAYNPKSKQCESKWTVPPPCGTYRECSDIADGFYPDLETKCSSYYICVNGAFFGHSLCPGNLVFNVQQGVCDYSYNAPPPCGTNSTGIVPTTTTSGETAPETTTPEQ